jgi:hypothetical protein
MLFWGGGVEIQARAKSPESIGADVRTYVAAAFRASSRKGVARHDRNAHSIEVIGMALCGTSGEFRGRIGSIRRVCRGFKDFPIAPLGQLPKAAIHQTCRRLTARQSHRIQIDAAVEDKDQCAALEAVAAEFAPAEAGNDRAHWLDGNEGWRRGHLSTEAGQGGGARSSTLSPPHAPEHQAGGFGGDRNAQACELDPTYYRCIAVAHWPRSRCR